MLQASVFFSSLKHFSRNAVQPCRGVLKQYLMFLHRLCKSHLTAPRIHNTTGLKHGYTWVVSYQPLQLIFMTPKKTCSSLNTVFTNRTEEGTYPLSKAHGGDRASIHSVSTYLYTVHLHPIMRHLLPPPTTSFLTSNVHLLLALPCMPFPELKHCQDVNVALFRSVSAG